MRTTLCWLWVVAGCGAATTTVESAPVEPPPHARLLDEDLRAPEGLPQGDLQLVMPELGSQLPAVILVGEPEPEEDDSEAEE